MRRQRPMGSHRFVTSLLCLVVSLFIVGCGASEVPKSSVKKAPISGTVMLGGQPLEGAEVYFYTEKFTGFGKTNAQGKFSLAQGAAVGSNKVYISKVDGPPSVGANDPVMALNDPGQVEAATASGAPGNVKQLVPPEFSNQSQTKLTFDVPAQGAKDADFNL